MRLFSVNRVACSKSYYNPEWIVFPDYHTSFFLVLPGLALRLAVGLPLQLRLLILLLSFIFFVLFVFLFLVLLLFLNLFLLVALRLGPARSLLVRDILTTAPIGFVLDLYPLPVQLAVHHLRDVLQILVDSSLGIDTLIALSFLLDGLDPDRFFFLLSNLLALLGFVELHRRVTQRVDSLGPSPPVLVVL